MLARLENEGIIEPLPPWQDPFVVAFQNMSYKTPVRLAPHPAQPALNGSMRFGKPLSASPAQTIEVDGAEAGMGEKKAGGVGELQEEMVVDARAVVAQEMLQDEKSCIAQETAAALAAEAAERERASVREMQGSAAAAAAASKKDAKHTQTVPGTVAAMLEGMMGTGMEEGDEDAVMGNLDLDVGEGVGEAFSQGLGDTFSQHFHSASPTSTGSLDEHEEEVREVEPPVQAWKSPGGKSQMSASH